MEKSKKILKEFLKELENGFNYKIKQFLNVTWSEKELFQNAEKLLKGQKFEIGKVEHVKYNEQFKQHDFKVIINGQFTTIFVRDGQIIPSKLMKFAVEEKKPKKRVKKSDK